jgi:hypothetical protein
MERLSRRFQTDVPRMMNVSGETVGKETERMPNFGVNAGSTQQIACSLIFQNEHILPSVGHRLALEANY